MKINYLPIYLCCFLFALLGCMSLSVQEKEDDLIIQILWYEMDLQNARNQGLFTRKINEDKMVHGDLIYSLLQGVRAGILRPFLSDTLKERMMYEEFVNRLDTAKLFKTQAYHRIILKKTLRFSKKQNQLLHNAYFSKSLFSKIESEENKGNEVYYEIDAMTILEGNGIPLATFSFAEVATNVLLDNPECTYSISENRSESMNMFDALNHGLYEAKLTQYQDNERNKIIKVQSENELQVLKSKYIPYAPIYAKISFLHSFEQSDADRVFKQYQLQ